jgi:hypothetical protein
MGLAGGIVRRVFSKSPCSSAGTGSRGHSVRASSLIDDLFLRSPSVVDTSRCVSVTSCCGARCS